MKLMCVWICAAALTACTSSRLSSRSSYTAAGSAAAAPVSTTWQEGRWAVQRGAENSWKTSIDLPSNYDNHMVANLVWVKNLPAAGGVFAKPIQVPCYVFMSESEPNSLLSLDRKIENGRMVITVSAERALTAAEQEALSKMSFRVAQVSGDSALKYRNMNYGAFASVRE